MNHIGKLLIGVGVGSLIGLMMPLFLIQVMITTQAILGQLIAFTIPLLIVFFVGEGIATLPNNSGKLLIYTLGGAYVSTLVAGMSAYSVSGVLIPELLTEQVIALTPGQEVAPFFTFKITPIFDVMTALGIAFLFGLGASALQQKQLKGILKEGREVVDLLLSRVIIPMLPLYIAGVFTKMAYEGTAFHVLETFGIVFLMILILHWCYLLILYAIASWYSEQNMFALIKTMLPAYMTAIGTMSSAATIPVTLAQIKKNKVRTKVANFMTPLCASIHLSGSVITLVVCSVAVIFISPQLAPVSDATMLGFIFLLGLAMIAAPGAPGGGVMSAIGLLISILGFDEQAIALIIALYLAQDSFGTACNVAGDGALALIVDHLEQKQDHRFWVKRSMASEK